MSRLSYRSSKRPAGESPTWTAPRGVRRGRALRRTVRFTKRCKDCSSALRRETLDQPTRIALSIAEAIMQTVLARLPELDLFRRQAVTTPKRRQGHDLIRVPQGQDPQTLVQLGPAGDDLALMRCPCPEPASERSRAEVLLGLRARHGRHQPRNAHLTLELRPIKDERGARVLCELPALAARVVRVEDEAALVDSLQ